MFDFFRNKRKDAPTSFKTLIFTEIGIQPFKNIDFSKQNVFEINDYALRNSEEGNNIYKELFKSSSYFEIWVIPTIINPEISRIKNLDKKINEEKDLQLQSYLYNLKNITEVLDQDITVNKLYLTVAKENSEIVTEKFKMLSFSLRNISLDEAKNITVLKREGKGCIK